MHDDPPPIPRARVSVEQIRQAQLVVVGVDGSEASVRALVWALRYAAENDAVVEVVTAWPMHAAAFIGEVPGHFNEARWQAVQAQARVIAHATSLVSESPPHTARVENARALDALIRAAQPASLLVLGTDREDCSGAGSWASFTVRAQHAAPCPVILVPNRSGAGDADAVERGQLVSAPAH
jgi:hypothetical protein